MNLRSLDVGHVFGESVVLLGDLECQFPRVTKDEDGNLAINGLELLQRCQDEDGGLPHATLCLRDHIHAQDSLS